MVLCLSEVTRGHPKNSDSVQFDPYAVLGVPADATKEEIHAAHRDGMAKYHPDKVAHLGVELHEVANAGTRRHD
ncbi:MAG: J domain-containing protein [Acidobacteriia bacterium]|nr:J domain-containing protein [Terriglobia bacterium]